MDDLKTNILAIFIGTETVRSFCEYHALGTTAGISPPGVLLFASLIKLGVAATCVGREEGIGGLRRHLSSRRMTEVLRFSIPAASDLLVHLMFFVSAASYTSTYALQLAVLAQVPATAALHHLWIKKQRNVYAWSCLIWLCLGLALLRWPLVAEEHPFAWPVALVAGLLIASASAISNVASETLTKSGAFWESQFWLCLWGAFFSIIAYPVTTGIWSAAVTPTVAGIVISETSITFSVFYTAVTACAGIASAFLLKYRDALARMVGTTTVLLIASEGTLYHATLVRQLPFGHSKLIGGLLAAVGISKYHKNVEVDLSNEHAKSETYLDVAPASPASSNERSSTHLLSEESEKSGFGLIESNSDSCSNGTISFKAILHASTFGVYPCNLPEPGRVQSALMSAVMFLKPSFLDAPRSAPKKLHPTAWLDGLRGVAAFIVFFEHTIQSRFPRLQNGWNGGTENLFLQLPLVRLLFGGHAAVATFFVVSGFSLAYGHLKKIRSRNFDGLITSLSSSVFRRPLRLYLPLIPISFISMLAVYSGIDDGRLHVIQLPWSAQLQHWIGVAIKMSNPLPDMNLLDWNKFCVDYLGVYWTIPFEFRGSMVVYAILLGGAKFDSQVRILLTGAIAIYFLYHIYWDLFLFLAGIILAELHHRNLAAKQRPVEVALALDEEGLVDGVPSNASGMASLRSEAQKSWIRTSSSRLFYNAWWIANFIFACYLFSLPTFRLKSRPDGEMYFKTIWSVTPWQYLQQTHWYRFWPAIGAVYMVYILDRCILLQGLFTNRFSQYLGRISFGMYLVHISMFEIIGGHVLEWVWAVTGTETTVAYTMGFIIAYPLVVPVIVWGADVYTRLVDDNCVLFTKWLFERFARSTDI